MTDKEKIEKLLNIIADMAERFGDEAPCIEGDATWCEEHCGGKWCPDEECYRHYLFGE